MKKAILLFAAIAVVALASCDKIPKGGTIVVINGVSTGNTLTDAANTRYVTVFKGEFNVVDAVKESDGTPLAGGDTKTWEFDEDGIYLVVAVGADNAIPPIDVFKQAVTLLAGNTETVTIK